jgi:hypothetical protein
VRLYHWSDPEDLDRMLLTARFVDPEAEGGRRTFTGVPLSADPPHADVDGHAEVDIPREIVEPFRVRTGRYLVPASVVRAYQTLREER